MTDETIFATAMEKASPAERAAFLTEICGDDTERRNRLEGLLAAHAGAADFLERPAVAVPAGGAETRTVGLAAGAPTDDDEAPFTFLQPSTRPDSLGRIGHYEVLQVLGKGGFGIVFRAFDDTLQRVVALKVLAPAVASTSPARKRFLREAQSSAQIRHDNVVQVYAVEKHPLPYLAMEFIPGETLQEKLNRTGPLDVSEVLRIGGQIAEGLAAAHACDLIHRDIKPGNILLEGGSHKAKITDFGLARAADDASISQSGVVAGTPMFMSPEQALGHKIDQRADLFSLGSVLYQMASGRPPFRAPSALAVLKRVADKPPRPIAEIIPETPDWLCGIIAKLHAKNPDDRFQSAREVADVLADCEAKLKAKQEVKNVLPAATRGEGRGARGGQKRAAVAAAVLLLPVIALAVTEFAGVTHLFRGQQATHDPIKPGGDLAAAVVAKKETPVAPITKQEPLPPAFKNSIGMEFVTVPKGKSWLGGGGGEPGNKKVEFKEDFYLGKYKITQEEWENVMGNNPSQFSRTGPDKDAVKGISEADLKRFPVDTVSWDEAQIFLNALNARVKEPGWIYRLPTVAEWEYACRDGPMSDSSESAFHFYLDQPTNELLPGQANFKHAGSLGRTCKVGSYKPNRLGLYDMHGNLWDWCQDEVKGKDGKSRRVIRGGVYHTEANACQAANPEGGMAFAWRRGQIGIRLARVPSGAPSPEAKTAATDPDRRAAEYVLSIGGNIRVDGNTSDIRAKDELPTGTFRLTHVTLHPNQQVTDSGLAVFKGCKNLTYLKLAPPVSDAGLIHFKDCKNLTVLDLVATAVTDAGLGHLKDCQNLREIYLAYTKVGDEGLAHFRNCKNVAAVNLDRTRVTDVGLGVVKDWKMLMVLNLSGLTVTDAGLAVFKECKCLKELHLNKLPVTDAGLAHLAGLNQLTRLILLKTPVTANGVAGLAKALPNCKIEWDGGVIEPTANLDPDRRAAEYVLSIRGFVRVDEQNQDIRAAADLPRVSFRLTYVNLWEKQMTAAGLGVFKSCKNLKELELHRSNITDAGLAHFKECKSLTFLNLTGTPVTDAGLAAFTGCKSLVHLDLSDTPITDAGLAHCKDNSNLTELRLYFTRVTGAGLGAFKGCKNLMDLNLYGTPVTDAALAHLKDFKKLTKLSLGESQITDEGLAHLKVCTSLTFLELRSRVMGSTKITAAGIDDLKKALPKCKIFWNGGVIEPR